MTNKHEHWLQRVRYTAAEPTSWLSHSRTLRQAAEDLWLSGNAHSRNLGSELGATVLANWTSPDFVPIEAGGSTCDVCFVVFGFALENLAKGICREVYIEDEVPEGERDMFIRFAADELERAAVRHAAEQAAWPRETDCDRLDRVEADLRDRGILLWQVSPCCDTCTGGELPERIDEIDRRHPGFRERLRGYAFFVDQNMPEMLAETTELSIYLAYGWFSPDDSNVTPDGYERNALGVAQEVSDCLREHGFESDWQGDFSRKIGVSLNWQRRTMLL